MPDQNFKQQVLKGFCAKHSQEPTQSLGAAPANVSPKTGL